MAFPNLETSSNLETLPILETKALSERPTSLDVVAAFDEFMSAFEAFKEANDERLAQIEEQVSADTVTVEKMERINRALDEHKRRLDDLVLKGRRPQLAGFADLSPMAAREHKAAWSAYMRQGDTANLRLLEGKALTSGAGPDGGYLVPEDTEREIMSRLADISPIRAIASVRQVSGNVYKKPFSVTGPVFGWVAEDDGRPETTPPVLAELQYPAMEIYAMPAASATLLDDTAVNIDQWIAEEVQATFAEQEGKAFVTGSGTDRPKGFMSYDKVASGAWEWGKTGFVATGAAANFGASPHDNLVDLIYSLKAGYRGNAHWVMNRATQAALRKIKDEDGNYLWQPGAQPGETATLMHFPIAESEDMADIGANAFPIAFGDFRRGYLVVDRTGVRVLRDPYSAKPYVLFYTTKRVGGGIQDFDAIKLLKVTAD